MEASHTFAILAYRESPHLQNCIDSLKKQTIGSKIIIYTSTPSVFLDQIASENNLHLVINPKQDGIAADWNFALNNAMTKYVTLAHQDDIYFPNYAEEIINAAETRENVLIIFSDYDELVYKNNQICVRKNSLNFFIKKTLLRLSFKNNNCITKNKTRLLAFGNPIGCPTVTFQKDNINDFKFDKNFSINMDWKSWYNLARKDGGFVWIKKTLVSHRIYFESETSHGLAENRRQKEDLKIFKMIWPTAIATILSKIYCLSYKNNN